MRSLTKITISAILSSALLCTLPLAAAHKAKTSKAKVRTVAATPSTKASSSKATSTKAKATHRTSSHKSSARKATKTATVSAHAGSKAKIEPVVITVPKPKYRGQQSIDSNRTMEIQQALIREHYMDGEATGEWDQATRDALTRFQSDNHWQTKILPDSRALIKLGLGPSHQNLLNPESAAIAVPYQGGIEKSSPGGSN